jgi:16S rRNA (guanine527-N7)-methyltransferase
MTRSSNLTKLVHQVLADVTIAERGLSVENATILALSKWVVLVDSWNQRIDLTAARSPEELVDLLIADALEIACCAPQGGHWVDVGSGAGAPGLGLALLRPDLRVTLVEPLQKRITFLRTVSGTLQIPSLEIVRARGEELVAKGRVFDHAVARATLAPTAWLSLGSQLAPRGNVWVLVAKESAPDDQEGHARAEGWNYRWPLVGVDRSLFRYAPQAHKNQSPEQ